MNLELIPSIASANILSYLNIREKLCAVDVLKSWESQLYTVDAWPTLTYTDQKISRIKDRQEFCFCLRKYGQYIKRININFCYYIQTSGEVLLIKIAKYCPNLCAIRIVEANLRADYPLRVIFETSQKLQEIGIIRPSVNWSSKENILSIISETNFSIKLKELVLFPEISNRTIVDRMESLLKPELLPNLQTLKVRCSFLSDELLLKLVQNSLKRLSVFQDEEWPERALFYKNETWKKVLDFSPNFIFSIALRNVIVLREFLPAEAPLQTLILADINVSLTKGLLDTISSFYHRTLQTFICSKSVEIYLAEHEDKRLPLGLLELTEKCEKLHTLVYGFNIPSAIVLLLAKCTKFLRFDISEDCLSYSLNDNLLPYLRTHHNWLYVANKSYGNLNDLEKEVSVMLGYEWTVSNEPKINTIEHYLRYF